MTKLKNTRISDIIEELKRLQIEHGNINCFVAHIREVDGGEETFIDDAWPDFRNERIEF